MAGYGSQTDYEADLLATYLRKGRVSPITRRDVNLALSIYKMPNVQGATGRTKTLTAKTAGKYAKGKSDSQIMAIATRAVLNKNLADRNGAKGGSVPGLSASNPVSNVARTASSVPPTPSAPTQVAYSGSLTPPRTSSQPSAPAAPRPSYSPRRPRRATLIPR
jgi:hypothetical protein